MAPISSQEAAFLMLWARLRWQSKSQERLLEFSRSISFFGRSQRFYLPLLLISRAGCQHRYYITKVGPWRKDGLEGHAPFCFTLFSAKDICSINFTFLTFICIQNRVRRVSFSYSGSRDEIERILYFGGEVQAREANSQRRSASSIPVLAI